jgi:branched-chain amino acid transport system permease protein
MAAPLAFFAVALVIGVIATNPYVLQQGTILWCYAMAVIGLAFAIQVSGEFLLAQGAIFCLAGYTAVICGIQWHVTYLTALLIGAISGALLGLIIGLGALRTSGWYFAMASFFLAAIVPNIIDFFPSLTGAETGLFGVGVATIGGLTLTGKGVYLLALGLLIACTAAVALIRRSRLGIGMAVMRERKAAAASLGFRPTQLRLIVFVVCSIPAGLGGTIYAHLFGFVQPDLFPLNQTIIFFAAVVIGGSALVGSLIAITALFIIPLVSLDTGSDQDIIYSVIIIVVAILVANGSALRGSLNGFLLRHDLRPFRAILGATDVAAADRTAAIGISPEGGRHAAHLLQRAHAAQRTVSTLRSRGMTVRFGQFQAVRFRPEDELSVTSGQVHALLGANGSGKTTLLNAICGHVPSRGKILLGSRPLQGLTAASRARLGLGRSWQSPALPGELTPRQLLSVAIRAGDPKMRRFGTASWAAKTTSAQLADQVLAAAGLGAQASRPISSLPSAHRRLLDLLVAIGRPVDFVVLDEPGAGLTRIERQALAEIVKTLAEEKIGVVLIEHDLDLAIRAADVVTVLDAGMPIYHGSPAGVRADDTARRLFLGQEVRAEVTESATAEQPEGAGEAPT